MDNMQTAFPVQQAKESIGRIVGPERVAETQAEPTGSPYKTAAALTAAPVNEDQVAGLLQWAGRHQYVVVPQGGGTKDSFGGDMQTIDILLSMKNMSGIVQHSVGDLMVTALPGTTLEELQQTLRSEGQFLPIDPGWGRHATLGGMVASGASGPKRALYGSVRDYLIASRVVLGDGTAIRTGAKVMKNVAGYDMNKLLVGSMGTLGVLTELTFKIRPLPAAAGVLAFALDEPDRCRALQAALLDSELEPCAAELVGPTLAESLFASPKPALVLLFEDVEPSVRYQLERARTFAADLGLKSAAECCGREQTEPLLERLRSIVPSSIDAPAERLVVSLKLLSSLTDVTGVYEFVIAAAEEAGLSVRFSGGLYTGISHAAIDADWERLSATMAWIRSIQAYMDERQGTAVVSFAPKQVRAAVAVWGLERDGWGLMRGMKQQLDPANILNRGRFVGGI